MPDSRSGLFSARARWLLPVDAPPVENGVLNVRDGLILSAGRVDAEFPLEDWGDVAIAPGWINAHTHLEFSAMETPLDVPDGAFTDWVRRLIAWRRQRDGDPLAGAEDKRRAVERGLRESLRGGAARLGEIATAPWPTEPFAESPIQGVAFLELLGLSDEHRQRLLELADAHAAPSAAWRAELSPHAPYTVSLATLEEICRRQSQPGSLVAMHLAESFEELELLASNSGSLRELLDELGAWDGSALPRGVSVGDYLNVLATADRSLVIHGNYLSDDEQDFIAQHADRMSVVYCPRTHAHFQHGDYPLNELLAAGVNVAVGTDSRASNPDLSLIDELRFLVHGRGESPQRALRMGTLAGAIALGEERRAGSLSAGKRADLTVIRLAHANSDDPHERLFDETAKVARVYIGGLPAYESS